MVPYVDIPPLELGPISIELFSVLVCVAVIVGFELVVRRAPHFGLDRDETATLVAWTIFWGFVGSHLFDVLAYEPELVLSNPLELLKVWSSMSSFGGMASGMLAAWIIMRRKGWTGRDQLAFVDLVGFSFPFAWIFGRMGCAIAHDHIGVHSTHWIAVQFPDGARFDLGLLECLYTIPIAVGFAVLARRRWPHPFFLGLFLTLYGPVRFAMDTLRAVDARYWGWTPGQYFAVFATLAGLTLLTVAYRGSRGARIENAAS
ncbi:MAG: prolipoprotein diacylglyceryl transferase [Proteobacteria bacterium]|nr:prolipoprotein diacylglyceryl transferase [Pseudomonadota bacterium]